MLMVFRLGYVIGLWGLCCGHIRYLSHGRQNQEYDSWVFSKHGVNPQNGHCYRKRDDKPSNSLQQRNYLALKPLYSIEIPTWCHIGCYTHSQYIHIYIYNAFSPMISPLYPQYNGRFLHHFSPSKKSPSVLRCATRCSGRWRTFPSLRRAHRKARQVGW